MNTGFYTKTNTRTYTAPTSSSYAEFASYSQDSNLLDGKDSSIFATTGSNTLRGNQIISGSLNTTGSVLLRGLTTTNQPSVVTVDTATGQLYYTASAAFVSTQTFPYTGSAIITGSLTLTGPFTQNGNYTHTGSVYHSGSKFLNGVFVQTGSLSISGSTTQIGNNTLLGNTLLSGSIIISGSTTTPTVQIYGNTTHNGYIRFDPVTTNIDQSLSASYIYVSGSTNDLYFTQNGDGFSNTTRLRWLEGNIYTGLLTGGVISGSVGGTTFNVSSGSGIIVTLNATTASREPYPTIKYVKWNQKTNVTPSFLTTHDTTWLLIDQNGDLIQQTSAPINGQYDTAIQIGSVIHPNLSTISLFKTFTVTSYGIAQQTYEFIRSFGGIKISGHVLSASGSSLSLNRASGYAYALGRNYVNDANKPSLVSDAGYNAPNIFKYYKSGSVFKTVTGTTTIDPTQYNTPSTSTGLSSVPGGLYTIQRVFYFPNQPDTLGVYYGRTTYNSITNALANIFFETFEENNNTLSQAIFAGYVVVKSGTSDLSNTNDANIIQAGAFRNTSAGGGGLATPTSLNDLSDVAITSPAQGDLFVYGAGTDWLNTKTLNGNYTVTGSIAISGGGVTGSLHGTASWAEYVVNGAGNTFPYSGNAIISGSLIVTGSTTSTLGFTGSLFGTSSWAVNASQSISSSFATTSSNALTASSIIGATSTEIEYLSGSTSNLQTQLNGRLTNDATVLGYNGLGSAIKGYPLGINLTAVGASTQFTNQRLWLIPIYVPADSSITGVRWLQIAAGGYTANNYNGVGLYSVSGGTINIAVSSSNNGNIWKTFGANTWGSQSFDAPYSAAKGSYFIGALLNSTATPSPVPSVGNVAIAAATVQSFDFTGGRLYNILATQLTMPTSVALSTTTGVTTGWYFALY